MNFNQLYIFHKVAEKKHFTRAAEELFISQPAVSKQIQELEKNIGQPLFEQIGRKVYLTEAGSLLYDYARQIFALSAEVETALKEMAGLERGKLALGASTTIGIYLLPQLLGEYKSRYPGIELTLEIANAEVIQAKLLANELEIGLVEGFVTNPELVKQIWQEDRLVLILPSSHPLAHQHNLTLKRLMECRPSFILREKGSGTRAVFEEALKEQGIEPVKPVLELGSTEAIKQAVAVGLGLSFVSEHTLKLELATGILQTVALQDFEITRPLYLVYARGKRQLKAVTAFLELLQLTKGDSANCLL